MKLFFPATESACKSQKQLSNREQLNAEGTKDAEVGRIGWLLRDLRGLRVKSFVLDSGMVRPGLCRSPDVLVFSQERRLPALAGAPEVRPYGPNSDRNWCHALGPIACVWPAVTDRRYRR